MGWHDSQLQVDCLPRDADDGKKRCLPQTPAALSPITFLDASCLEPNIIISNCAAGSPLPTFATAIAENPLACSGNLTSVFELGPEVFQVFVNDPLGSGCVATTLPAGIRAFAKTPVAASSFVEVTTTIDP